MSWTADLFIQGKCRDVYALVHNKHCDFKAFLDDCQRNNPKGYTMLLALLKRIAESGPPMNEEHFRFLEKNFYEIKAIGARLFCFFDPHEQRIIILTHGWKKAKVHGQEQQREIALARRYRDAYLQGR